MNASVVDGYTTSEGIVKFGTIASRGNGCQDLHVSSIGSVRMIHEMMPAFGDDLRLLQIRGTLESRRRQQGPAIRSSLNLRIPSEIPLTTTSGPPDSLSRTGHATRPCEYVMPILDKHSLASASRVFHRIRQMHFPFFALQLFYSNL